MPFSSQIDASAIEECPRLSQVTRLDENQKEIRLLRLRDDDIKIEKYQLFAAPSYYAISYCWGPAIPVRRICVQGEFVAIRENVANLFEALQQRYGGDTRFWLDMLCIDQHYIPERNSQVSMMDEIYSRATGVITWLGPSTALSHSAFQIIRERLFCPANAPVRLWCNGQQTRKSSDGHVKWPSMQQLETDHDLYRAFAEDIVWPALADVLRRSYWNRMWVVQEMIAAAECTLLCGSDAISLDDFVAVGNLWVTKGEYYQPSKTHAGSFEIIKTSSYQDLINTWVPVRKISRQYRTQYKQGRILLMELVDNFASRQCSNIRDKVFALRCLSKEAAMIKVDYSKTVLETFLSLVQSGLLMSNGARGFQSLPSLIRCMGIDYDTLDEQLADLPRSLININGRPGGAVVTTRRLECGSEAGPSGQQKAFYIRVTNKDKEGQQVELYRSSTNERASAFLDKAQPRDILCTVPTASPILLLLRPQGNLVVDSSTTYEAVENLNNWECEWDPSADLSAGQRIIGEVQVSSATAELDCSQPRNFSIESHSLRGLTLWKAMADKRYWL